MKWRFRFTQGERVRRHLAPLLREEKSSLLLLAPNSKSFMYIESATAFSSEGLAGVPGSHLLQVIIWGNLGNGYTKWYSTVDAESIGPAC